MRKPEIIPTVEIQRTETWPHMLRHVFVNGAEIPVKSISVQDSVGEPQEVILTLVADVVNTDLPGTMSLHQGRG